MLQYINFFQILLQKQKYVYFFIIHIFMTNNKNTYIRFSLFSLIIFILSNYIPILIQQKIFYNMQVYYAIIFFIHYFFMYSYLNIFF